MKVDLARAREDLRRIGATPAGAGWKQRLELLDKRIQVFGILVENCRNALQYQYLLDFMKGGRLRRPVEFQQHLTDITEWRTIKEVGRREMDNSIVLGGTTGGEPGRADRHGQRPAPRRASACWDRTWPASCGGR